MSPNTAYPHDWVSSSCLTQRWGAVSIGRGGVWKVLTSICFAQSQTLFGRLNFLHSLACVRMNAAWRSSFVTHVNGKGHRGRNGGTEFEDWWQAEFTGEALRLQVTLISISSYSISFSLVGGQFFPGLCYPAEELSDIIPNCIPFVLD